MTTIETLKDVAPSAFRMPEEGAANGVSKHYKFMTTMDIINILESMHWNLYNAKQQKSKKNPETTKHMLTFRNPMFGSVGVGGNIPQILLVNSHDRTSSLAFYLGIYRLICSNGAVVQTKSIHDYNVRHMGTEFNVVKQVITEITNSFPIVFESISKFGNKIMTPIEQREFALRSLAIRYPEYINQTTGNLDVQNILDTVDFDSYIKPIRMEDNGNDLWTVFNKSQEKLIKGGFQRIGDTGKSKAVRPITNILTDVKVNQGLWSLAESFV